MHLLWWMGRTRFGSGRAEGYRTSELDRALVLRKPPLDETFPGRDHRRAGHDSAPRRGGVRPCHRGASRRWREPGRWRGELYRGR